MHKKLAIFIEYSPKGVKPKIKPFKATNSLIYFCNLPKTNIRWVLQNTQATFCSTATVFDYYIMVQINIRLHHNYNFIVINFQKRLCLGQVCPHIVHNSQVLFALFAI